MKKQYTAMVHIINQNSISWATASTKGKAMVECRKQLKRDWSHLFNVNSWLKTGNATCDIFEDAGTDSFDDDTYIETVPLI